MSEPNVRAVPKFPALRAALEGNPQREAVKEWIDKLEEWAEAAHVEIARLDRVNSQMTEDMLEMVDAEGRLEELEERIRDVDRGIVDVSELLTLVAA